MARVNGDITAVDCIGYPLLACEVVHRAIQDWIILSKGNQPQGTTVNEVNLRELSRFFNSGYCDGLLALCNVELSGKKILSYLKETRPQP